MTFFRPIDRQILRLSVPCIISNATVPLLGLVDATIAGHFGAAAYIGAIAVGGMALNMLYWLLGFLRMGTGGLTSQAYGRADHDEIGRMFFRSLTLSAALGSLIVALQGPILHCALWLIPASTQVARLASTYFNILIWGAPAMLMLYSLNGWFVGMQNTRYVMATALVQNGVNIALSLLLVVGLNWKIEGPATGTLVAQYAGLLAGLWWWHRRYAACAPWRLWPSSFGREALKRFFSVNRDIFLRTLCLVAVTTFFTAGGAAEGDTILAVNALLMQLFMLFSYVMDGFAYTAEALSGRYYGAADRQAFQAVVRRLMRWGTGVAAAFTVVYFVGGTPFLRLLTDNVAVIEAARPYLPWAIAIPAAGFAAFLFDGIYIGLTATRAMLTAMAGSAAAFFLLFYGLRDAWANHALWLAFLSYLFLRGALSALLFGRQTRRMGLA